MNTYAEKRREHLAAILTDGQDTLDERITTVVAFVEGEVKAAFTRGLRQPKARKADNSQGAAWT